MAQSLSGKKWKSTFFSTSRQHTFTRRHYISGPSLRASVDAHLHRILPTSLRDARQNLSKELQWNQRFTVAFSKDNVKHHPQMREYFDVRRAFDDYWDCNSPGLGTQPPHSNPMKSSSCKSTKQKWIGLSPNKGRKAKRISMRETEWKPVYAPVSEFNLTKHAAQREYFQRIRK